MTVPTIPPRPSRSQQSRSPSRHMPNMDAPKIPPRPKRSVDRSVSPNRDAFARSPLNDPAFLHDKHHHRRGSGLSQELPPRPPSVTLPALGQEGMEYASLDDLSKTLSKDEGAGAPQMKQVAGDLPLYAPKASVPSSTAKSRIQAVTRTDSSQAAAAGFGKLAPEDKHQAGEPGRSGSSAGHHTRPSSIYDQNEEQGIPEIGVQVPMYPNAGDVQAPTPQPFDQAPSGGVGFFNKGGHREGRHHGRTKSGREFYGPPGSYGLHGHGIIPKNEFEQQWYAKHPEDRVREEKGEYGPRMQQDRKDYHWVGDDLVKLVHSSAASGAGVGTSREAIGTPDEQIGYLAHEEFASRIASPKPPSGRPGSISSKTGMHVDSPLRHETGPELQADGQDERDEGAVPAVIHIDPPSHPTSKIHGGGYDPPTEDLGPEGGNSEEKGGLITEQGYGVPILASDEVGKRQDVAWRQPAVTPELERRASGEYTINEPGGHPLYITKPRTHSRSSSRNSNRLSRFASPDHGHLESTKEYEPLFPEDDDEQKKPKTAADKLKRPEIARHHFPSQDVWEDTPSSLQLETTVETPQGPEEAYEEQANPDSGTVFEHPEEEQERMKRESEEDKRSFLPEKTKRFTNKHVNKEHLGGGRPGQHRFPSHDIWEDAPDHGQLVTTVSTEQTDDTNEYADASPVTEKPLPFSDKPRIPPRPQAKENSPVEKKAAPVIPERPKPSVPARPAKPLTKSTEKLPTLDTQSSSDAPAPKPKPPVPARPAGSKIAALQAGFLQDLNQKLGLGPQAPKTKESEPENEEESPKPLQDARKGRAKGPQRRKPAAASSPAPAAEAEQSSQLRLDTSSISTVWTIEEDGEIDVPAARMAKGIMSVLSGGKTEQHQVEKTQDQPEVAKSEQVQDTDVEKVDTAETFKSEEPEEQKSGILGTVTGLASSVVGSLTGSGSPTKDNEDEGKGKTTADEEKIEEKSPVEPEGNKSPAKQPTEAEADEPSSPVAESADPEVASSLPKDAEVPAASGIGPVPTSEPVDMALMEEGKDAETREIGL
ncbi:hypothetical protein M011DRAFT_457869 [Sporormia fimetaria CBS 119925]|uniref:Altered inheritance of mitochondria protein 21 n=1 Tax=Sporormia fimetaria CBS 119925 TaxID=1340428 RepID=A0A6A6VCQ2_9PLEO|nr:hypothetical protein M011DRAFT_457869 [Sporormia fimetaria CBS 119925]